MVAGLHRRELLAAGAALAAGCCGRSQVVRVSDGARAAAPGDAGHGGVAGAASVVTDDGILRRAIPSSGERIPVIGLGSWQTFDVDDVAPVTPVVARFLALGGRVIDSSPMYGRAEAAIGRMLQAIDTDEPDAPTPWLATKVWTQGQRAGVTQMRRSLERLGRPTGLDLMQVHNLVDWQAHLETLRAWKADGTVRYVGVTHYDHGAFAELERIVRSGQVDAVQLPYNVLDREAERRLLPAAQGAGVAVLVMEPFATGELFARVKGRPVPAWAAELDCTSWAQLFLKFILGHPAVTCPIPATARVAHVEDNLGALRGRLPDDEQRARIVRAVEGR